MDTYKKYGYRQHNFNKINRYRNNRKKKSEFDINDCPYISSDNKQQCSQIVFDNGILCMKLSDNKFLVSHFNQDKGIIEETNINEYPIKFNKYSPTATGKYLYFANAKKNDNNLYRITLSDLEKGITDNIEIINPTSGNINSIYQIRIGIDGNLYIDDANSNIMVVYDSESDNPKLQTLYTNIPNAIIQFPNFLYTYELFQCNTDCNKNASFSFPDKNKEILTYEWDFGDNKKSKEANPVHHYNKPGTYTVSLSCTLKNGQKKNIPSRKIVISEGKTSASFNNSQICLDDNPLEINLNGTAPFEVTYTLNSKESTIKTSEKIIQLKNIPGKYKLTNVKDKTCEFSPSENNEAEIFGKISKPKIIAE